MWAAQVSPFHPLIRIACGRSSKRRPKRVDCFDPTIAGNLGAHHAPRRASGNARGTSCTSSPTRRMPRPCGSLNVQAWKSTDGGRVFDAVTDTLRDQHDLWIDPRDPRRIIEGNDGGACVSFNGGAPGRRMYNQPTAQFYHVVTDDQLPYRIYGAQQDINTLSVPSRSSNAAITPADWYSVGGGESGHVAVRDGDPNTVYAGSFGGHLTRYDHRTGQLRDISVWPDDPMGWGAGDLKYRFQWTFPLVGSRHDPDVAVRGLAACSSLARPRACTGRRSVRTSRVPIRRHPAVRRSAPQRQRQHRVLRHRLRVRRITSRCAGAVGRLR